MRNPRKASEKVWSWYIPKTYVYMDKICWMVVGHVSALIGNSRVGVTYSGSKFLVQKITGPEEWPK